ncbi:hypothetical protein F5B19DRAFT_308468 [Rostrohypoxylon terebratum]|nr:hypothetical protein F5B19DRAFT_308468 [Rostrohypoxylon terebratum]
MRSGSSQHKRSYVLPTIQIMYTDFTNILWLSMVVSHMMSRFQACPYTMIALPIIKCPTAHSKRSHRILSSRKKNTASEMQDHSGPQSPDKAITNKTLEGFLKLGIMCLFHGPILSASIQGVFAPAVDIMICVGPQGLAFLGSIPTVPNVALQIRQDLGNCLGTARSTLFVTRAYPSKNRRIPGLPIVEYNRTSG